MSSTPTWGSFWKRFTAALRCSCDVPVFSTQNGTPWPARWREASLMCIQNCENTIAFLRAGGAPPRKASVAEGGGGPPSGPMTPISCSRRSMCTHLVLWVTCQLALHLPPEMPTAPRCAYAGCHSITSQGTGHLGLELFSSLAGSSTACILYGWAQRSMGQRSGVRCRQSTHSACPQGTTMGMRMGAPQMSQSPPCRQRSSRPASGWSSGSQGGCSPSAHALGLGSSRRAASSSIVSCRSSSDAVRLQLPATQHDRRTLPTISRSHLLCRGCSRLSRWLSSFQSASSRLRRMTSTSWL
mmetsp:Transcript_17744/g.45446  ORF Transcript_17744/g.45446 Transcript_17744/m.45446 type:complete len:298 (+) Transcript_17744:712-1605(+)